MVILRHRKSTSHFQDGSGLSVLEATDCGTGGLLAGLANRLVKQVSKLAHLLLLYHNKV